MTGILTFFRGSVRVELRCKYSERAVNICARNHVDFHDLVRTSDGAARMTVDLAGYITLRRVARETGAFSVRIVLRRGAPFILWRIRKRYALIAGLAACAILLGLSSVFVWQIDVTGNETVSSSQILAALRSEGVDIGSCTLKISEERVENRMLLKIPKLSFLSLNTHGSRIEVVVREKIPRPELYDPEAPTSVYAKKAGIIANVLATQGRALVKAGDAVDVGDELISSYVPLGRGLQTHAAGSVLARTWYELRASAPTSGLKKEYTGEKKVKRAIILGGKRINLYFMGGNPYTDCDKITVYKKLTLPGGSLLPVTFVTDTFEEYEPRQFSLSEDEAVRMLKARLLFELEGQIGSGSVTTTDYETSVKDGVVTVTLRAECLEEIAVERALTEDELTRAAPPDSAVSP